MPACLHTRLPARLPAHLPAHLPASLPASLPVRPPACLSVCPPVRLLVCIPVCPSAHLHVCMYVWACGLVVSMFDFHRSDCGSNPDRGGEIFMFTTTIYCGTIGKCLNHYANGSPKPCEGIWEDEKFGRPSVAELARFHKLS